MGIIDPMVFSSGVATGWLEFSIGPALWFLTVGLLVTAGVAIALSSSRPARIGKLNLPKLAHAQLAAVGVSRAR
jgi:hypothetical protein